MTRGGGEGEALQLHDEGVQNGAVQGSTTATLREVMSPTAPASSTAMDDEEELARVRTCTITHGPGFQLRQLTDVVVIVGVTSSIAELLRGSHFDQGPPRNVDELGG